MVARERNVRKYSKKKSRESTLKMRKKDGQYIMLRVKPSNKANLLDRNPINMTI